MIQIYKAGNEEFEKNGDAVLHPTVCSVEEELKGSWKNFFHCFFFINEIKPDHEFFIDHACGAQCKKKIATNRVI